MRPIAQPTNLYAKSKHLKSAFMVDHESYFKRNEDALELNDINAMRLVRNIKWKDWIALTQKIVLFCDQYAIDAKLQDNHVVSYAGLAWLLLDRHHLFLVCFIHFKTYSIACFY